MATYINILPGSACPLCVIPTHSFCQEAMFRNHIQLIYRFASAVVLLVAVLSSSANAQLQGRLADRPIGVGYLRDLDQVSTIDYAKKLSKRLEIGETTFNSVPTDRLEAMKSQVEVPIHGASWFMVQGLIPSWETVYFQQVADLDDARRVINGRKTMMGDRGEVEVAGDGKFKFIMTNSWSSPVASEEAGQKQVDQINARHANSPNQRYRQTAKLIEKDGKPHVEQGWEMKEFYRYHDNLLFSTHFEELWDMDLPSRDSITSSISSENDLGLEAFFDRIPMAIKTLGWNMLSSTAGTQMQQRDGEEQTLADLRKTSMQVGLDIVRSVMFDVEETNGWIRFADERDQNVRAEINFQTRRNSGLTKQLDEVAGGISRFAPILADDAAGTLHFCFRISEDAGQVPRAAAAFLKQAAAFETGSDAVFVDAVTRITDSLSAFGESRVLEAFLKAGWTEESGGVLYGGIQVDDNPELLRGLYHLMTNAPGAPSTAKEAMSFSETEGQQSITVVIPEHDAAALQRQTSINISHVYIIHRNSCLWIAGGRENAIQILNRSAAKCENAGLAARAPLITASIDVERWLSYPQDDEAGIGGLLTWLDANVSEFPPSPMSFQFSRRMAGMDKPAPLLQRCIDLGGDRKASFSVIADRSGVRASAKMGEAIANYYVARMVDGQDRMMRFQRKRAEERSKEAREKAKAALEKKTSESSE